MLCVCSNRTLCCSCAHVSAKHQRCMCVCARRDGCSRIRYPQYCIQYAQYCPCVSMRNTAVCAIPMYPMYPVSAILAFFKYPKVSRYPCASRLVVACKGFVVCQRQTRKQPRAWWWVTSSVVGWRHQSGSLEMTEFIESALNDDSVPDAEACEMKLKVSLKTQGRLEF